MQNTPENQSKMIIDDDPDKEGSNENPDEKHDGPNDGKPS